MSSMMRGFFGTQILAAMFGLAYFALLTYRGHSDAFGVGLRIWGYFAAMFLMLHVLLALKQWWQKSRRR